MKKGTTGFSPENLIPTDIPATWKAMESLVDSGKTRAIGVSNFSTKKLADLLEIARIPPAANQVECHPSWQQGKLREFCKSKGVHLSVSSKSSISVWFITTFSDYYKESGTFCWINQILIDLMTFFRDTHHWVLLAPHGSRAMSLSIQF